MVDGDGSWTNDEVRKVLRDTAKDLRKEEGMDNTFGYGLLSLHFPPWQQKPALVIVVAVDSSSYTISYLTSGSGLCCHFLHQLDYRVVADALCRMEAAGGALGVQM